MDADRIDIVAGTVCSSEGDSVTLRPKAAQVLAKLATRQGDTVSKEDLMDAVWPDTHVTENSLQQSIHEIRQALGKDGAQIIRTIPGKGYRMSLQKEAFPNRYGWATISASIVAFLGFAAIVGLASQGLFSGQQASDSTRIVAVVPFENQTGDPRWDLLAKGLSQDTATDLARSDFVRVMTGSPSSKPLSSDYSLQGSFQNQDGELRVRAWLTNADDGVIVWSHRWSGPETDVFNLQDEVVDGVSAAVLSPWSGAIAVNDRQTARARSTDSLAAYELYLLGAYHKHRFTPDDYRIAADYLKRAIETDPSYAKAYSTLAVVYALTASNITVPDELHSIVTARAAAIETAADLAPNDPQTLVQLNWLNGYRGDFELAEKVLRRAVELAPNNADVLAEAAWVGNWRGVIGRDSVEWAERAMALHDTWPDWYAVGAGISRFNLKDFEGCVTALTEAPNFIERHLYTAAAEALQGNLNEARSARDRLLAIAPNFNLETYMIARVIQQDEVREPLLEGATLAKIPILASTSEAQ